MKTKGGKLCLAVISLLVVFSYVTIAAATSPDLDFFKGKVVQYIVSTKPGGGHDLYARVISKYMQKYIPGSTIIVKNVPGAGHIIGANEIYLSKPNGLTIGTFSTGIIYAQILSMPGVRFDLGKYSWIGKANSETWVLIVSVKSPYKTFNDIMESKQPVTLGAAGVGTAAYNDVLILAAVTGAPLKVIPGYTGRETEMAMMRGEVVGQMASYAGLMGFIKAKECRVILQCAAKKHKDLKDVPLASELKLNDTAKKMLALIDGQVQLGRLACGPPNIPAGRLQVLRNAYKKVFTDPDFLKETARMDMDLDPGFGDDVARLVKAAVNQPPENMAILKKIIKVEQ